MQILVINSGSSSIKFRLIDTESEAALLSGRIENIGVVDQGLFVLNQPSGGIKEENIETCSVLNHAAGFSKLSSTLRKLMVFDSPKPRYAVAHRVVHGGEDFFSPVQIDERVISSIRKAVVFAPLHNPACLAGIEEMLELYPEVPHVAVFDTGFFQTLPPRAYRYALPEYLYSRYGVRRFGFHGISHQFVAEQADGFLEPSSGPRRLVTLHLGNGASAAAVLDGCCIDTSMGMTPLEGLVMGTRCGDLDAAITIFLARNLEMDTEAIEDLLLRQSGLKGLCGTSDMREVHRLADSGDANARLAIELFCYRICKYIGSYQVSLGGLDALVFTAGIAENDPAIRQQICQGLSSLNIALDPLKNRLNITGIREISAADSAVRVLVVPTNEELAIALQAAALLGAGAAK